MTERENDLTAPESVDTQVSHEGPQAEELAEAAGLTENPQQHDDSIEDASEMEDEPVEEAQASNDPTPIDFAGMSEEQILAHADEWAKSDKEIGSIGFLHDSFLRAEEAIKALHEAAKAEALAKFKAGNEDSEEGFNFEPSQAFRQFMNLLNLFRKDRAGVYEAINKERESNLKAKQDIIEKVKSLIDGGDISKLLRRDTNETVKALRAQWKEAGPVPQANADELYQTYKAVLDRYYDQRRIALETQQLDRQRNLASKINICERAEALLKEENLNDAVRQLNKLHDDYKALGPVPRANHEEIWQRFKQVSDVIYEKKRAYAEEYKKQLQQNMELKQALCLRAEGYLSFSSDSIKEWNKATQELLELQKEWDAVGALPREVAKEINKQFWSSFKQFFNNKNKFFEVLDKGRQDNLKKKEALCEQAEAAQESNDWDATTDLLKELQQQWRKIGAVPEKFKDSIYERFKAACDKFFERKRNRRQEEGKAFDNSQKRRDAISAKIVELAKKKGAEEELLKLKQEFMAAGEVRGEAMNRVNETFSEAVEAYYKATLPAEEAEQKTLELLVDMMRSSAGGGDKHLGKKKQALRNQISGVEHDIALLQNNMEFFTKSKNADALMKDFAGRVAKLQEKADKLKKQLNLLNSIEGK